MWNKNAHIYTNNLGQEVELFFRSTNSSDWKFEDSVYNYIYEVKLATEWGNQWFWYCFSEREFPQSGLCEIYLQGEQSAFELLAPYLQSDISEGLGLGAILPRADFGVLVFGRPH